MTARISRVAAFSKMTYSSVAFLCDAFHAGSIRATSLNVISLIMTSDTSVHKCMQTYNRAKIAHRIEELQQIGQSVIIMMGCGVSGLVSRLQSFVHPKSDSMLLLEEL